MGFHEKVHWIESPTRHPAGLLCEISPDATGPCVFRKKFTTYKDRYAVKSISISHERGKTAGLPSSSTAYQFIILAETWEYKKSSVRF